MNALLAYAWQYLRGLLPYPDLRRRWRIRRQARQLLTVTKWPGDDATGPQAAQLALLRLLWLQRRIRRAVRGRRREEAALLARAAVDTCLIGLYCQLNSGAVAHLAGANYRTLGKVASAIVVPGIMSAAAVESSITSLGEPGDDLKVGNVARKLAAEHNMPIARQLYDAYYMPLSHFFEHANAFTLLRHVGDGDTVTSKPWDPWARRSPARLGDACTGLLAANIAKQAGIAPEPFLAYAAAHLDRVRTPLVTMGIKGAIKAARWKNLPRLISGALGLRAYTHRTGLADTLAQRDEHIRAEMTRLIALLNPDTPEGMFAMATDELTAKILAEMSTLAADRTASETTPT